MEFITTLISPPAYIHLPDSLTGWVACIVLIGLTILLQFLGYRYNNFWGRNRFRSWIPIVLVLITPLTSLFLGLRVSVFDPLTMPDLPGEMLGVPAMFLATLPWMIAAGLLGPLPTAGLAAFAGLFPALYNSHSLLPPLIMALLATLFSIAVRQRYRTRFFRLARSPLVASTFILFIFPMVWMLFIPFSLDGLYVVGLDFTTSWLGAAWIALGIELFIAALVSQGLSILKPNLWGGQPPYDPSPAEKSIQTRLVYSLAPLVLVLLIAMFLGSWLIAASTARSLIRSQMVSLANTISGSVPFFRQSAQELLNQMSADPRLASTAPAEMGDLLEELIKNGSFFSRLTLFGKDNTLIASFPENEDYSISMPFNEHLGIQLAISGAVIQDFPVSHEPGSRSAEISFIVPVRDAQGQVNRVLVGNVTPELNPLTKAVLDNLATLNALGLEAALFHTDDKTIVMHSNPDEVMTEYSGPTIDQPRLIDDIGPDGRRRLVYYLPIPGENWNAAIIAPAAAIQQLALGIAAPMIVLVLLASLLSVLILRYGLRDLRSGLSSLAADAELIARGRLDQPIAVAGEDEISQLRKSFEAMRQSLKARLDELNRLLQVTRGVASNLDMEEAVRPVLESALASGACSARIVLSAAAVPDLDNQASGLICYSAGLAKDLYRDLDEQLSGLTRQQNRVVLANLTRLRLLNLDPARPHPASLMATALRHEDYYYGTLWVAYDQPHTFSEEETRYMSVLAGQAALAAANARSYLNAEIGRQRLAAILASSPDPILVTDQHNNLILANPAARLLIGLGIDAEIGQPVERVIKQRELFELLRDPKTEKRSLEVAFTQGQVYLAAVSDVIAEGQKVGRVCLLRDVTRFKELDTLKTEFVSTVSHDLRTPLTLIRGYATMLEMVGPLNEQQTGYARKIIGGAENMSRLVNNLLDLGRIEAGVGLKPEMISASELAARVIDGLQVQANQKKIQLRLEHTQQPNQLVEADPALLQQALHNLLENAIKYSRNDGKVTVLVNSQKDRMIFEVSDNGIGISPMDQARLFEKFYHPPQQVGADQSGSGLGLAIVRSVAEKHGGQVWLESQLGKGSTFYLAIPLRQAQK